ncbi:MBL fold metallo-hydrolase [Aneurinibacillus migulanus]|uniref:Glyoxylase, beta-lactamase superfamily II n=1 Tax=Aneurinibacillus migulanus TaxID=47500 RepID=A0A0K2WLC4_ANEMI|nr:MBL fold metallo-hydrolase [Aneurinibacillus migulanus]MCP1355731.1 MBL fold metallo-hydrolase [Aneurinibacillus migulanus]MED0891698.1 MBL fold metallo-hydrolase [Aneurinibacillus migulanus]MED1617562.1 MBL fold metallo-hydrolase [Aneurinibacillus migulanus]CEH32126.1 Metallo-beta-lactamase domain protein [Aneurinibacillus migulanus]SDI32853.1 Glyoxylase, beta-lactamase superfamily II [Aneurinibacillus migulanus]
MRIYTFPLGPLQTNCYVVANEETNEAIIIDAGMHPSELLDKAGEYEVRAILLTHAHFDHMGGLEQVRKKTGAPVYIHNIEQEWLTNPNLNGSSNWPMIGGPMTTDYAEHEVKDGDMLTLAGFNVQVMETPGHTPGGVSFLIGQELFSGDTLFAHSIGRTDLPGGNYEQLIRSIQEKLMPLPEETRVYPGHGPDTTIGFEKLHNPFIVETLR